MTQYFEFYQLPVSLNIDTAVLKKLFFEKSRNNHPDFFANASEEIQQKALAESTVNNEAYKTLLNPQTRLKHVLHIYGLLADEDKMALPPDFLMDMMDLNEEIEMAAEPEGREEVKNKIEALIADNEQEREQLFEQFDTSPTEGKNNILKQLTWVYLKNKYFLRLTQSVSTFADPKR